MVHGVELPEQVRVGFAGDAQPQWCRATRAGQSDGLDLDDLDAELVLDGVPDGVGSPTAHVEVGRLALAVRDREQLVRREEAEGEQRDADAEGDADEHVEGVVDAEVQAGEGDEPDHDHPHGLGDRAWAAGHDEGVDVPDDREPDDGDGRRRQRVALPRPR